MGNLIPSFLLGILQGLTEFIPVSSTGHLILLEKALDFQAPPGKIFEVVIQLGSAFAVLFAYFQRLLKPIAGSFSSQADRRFLLSLTLATIPAALLGFCLHDIIKEYFYGAQTVALSLLIGGIILLWVDRKAPKALWEKPEETSPRRAFVVGLCQSIALIPGVSRSGATMASCRLLGLAPQAATEFSFFLSVPILMGAGFYDLLKAKSMLTSDHAIVLGVGFLAAFFSSYLVFRPLVVSVQRWGFSPFAWYRIALGLLLLIFVVSS